MGRILRTSRDGTTRGGVLWVVVRGPSNSSVRQRVSIPFGTPYWMMQLASVARLQSTGGELTSRLALLVPAVQIVWTPPVKYVGIGQVGVAPHVAGPFRFLASEVSHVIWVPLFTRAGVLLTTMLPSPPKGPSDLVAGRRRIKCRCRDVVDVEAHRDRAVRPQDLEACLVTAGQVAERVSFCAPADGVGAVAVVVGRRELAVCDRDVARTATDSVGLLRSFRPGTASLLLACLLVLAWA